MKRSRDEVSEDEGVAESDPGECSDDDIEDDTVPGYDAGRESLPPSKVFTPEFKDMLVEIQKIIGLLIEPIASSSNRSPVTEGLLEEIVRRTKGDYPEEVRIAIVGAMKSGMFRLSERRDYELTIFRQELARQFFAERGYDRPTGTSICVSVEIPTLGY